MIDNILNPDELLLVNKTKSLFFKMIKDFGSDPYLLSDHVPEMEKWAYFMLDKYSQADKIVVLLSVWLHDIGHYPIPIEIDHAVRSGDRATKFLEDERCDTKLISQVFHCVRAHRCRDIMPETLEAKIIACIDSASHMTSSMYFDMMRNDKGKIEPRVWTKIERDYRDLAMFPEVQVELKSLYESWKILLKNYEDIKY